MHKIVLLLLIALGLESSAQKPKNDYSVQGWWSPVTVTFSPVVHQDRSITFRLKAKNAAEVKLIFGEWNIKPMPMNKDTAGTWQVTIPPVAPGIYSYQFCADGLNVTDPANPVVKSGTEIYGSIVEVSEARPRFDEVQQIPHGTLSYIKYHSSALNRLRGMVIFFPAEYGKSATARFPVLYLRHGGGDNETSWTQAAGKADVILENLIAAGKAKPMIIVMTNGLTDGTWAGGSSKEGIEQLEQELLKDVIPYAEKNFRIRADKGSRAIAGLSMGGGQAYIIGLKHQDMFSYIGEFSSGLLSDAKFDINERIPGVFNKPEAVNANIKLLWIACGKDDPRYPGHLAMGYMLREKKIRFESYESPGGHEWRFWREQLRDFIQRLF
ncbi:MAG TPA: alpha/beta hydrolase-fold protein [Pedobacter sp.]|nr:alpha/beta hydrolase-fold protein [Pedobacter sp.]